MSQSNPDQAMVQSSPARQFFRFVVPSVFGMLALSSASIVDGVFIGNFVGATALASVNLTMPVLALVFGVLIMLTTGATALVGKLIGEQETYEASDVFSKAAIAVLVAASLISAASLLAPEAIVRALSAHGETVEMAAEYLWTMAWFFPVFGLQILLSQIVRVDGRPGLSFLAMVLVTVSNIALDAALVAWLGWGVTGAALATGLASLAGVLVLGGHFFLGRSKLGFVCPSGSWRAIPKAATNGFSEFLNEASNGLVVFLFNWILMTQVGALGVAAFTIVDYAFYIGVLVFYGVGEGMASLISVNFGARKPRRILKFLGLGIGVNLFLGTLSAISLLIWSDALVSAFLDQDDVEIRAMVMSIVWAVWATFLFNGTNLAMSAYFTGMQCARQSAMIAISRSLVLPVVLIFVFWWWFGYLGAFYALPLSEALTLILSFWLFRTRMPHRVIRQ